MNFIIGLGILQGILIILFFLPIKKNRKANIWLMAMILLAIIQMLLLSYIQLPFQIGGSLILKILVRLVVFLIPSCLFFYFRFLIEKNIKLSLRDLIHAFPAILATGYLLYSYGAHIGQEDPWSQIDEQYFAKEWFGFLLIQSIVIIAYGVLLFKLYSGYRSALKDNFATLEGKQLQWLLGLIKGDFIIGIAGLLGGLLSIYAFANVGMNEKLISNAIIFILVVVSICTFWITFKAIKVPELFRVVEFGTKKEKYSHSILPSDKYQNLENDIIAIMEEQQLYLDAELNLGMLAQKLGHSNQILSQYLNQSLNTSFYDFVNDYRLRQAKRMLIDPNFGYLTIEAIAKESGFKSKSTFYSFFKRKMGLTPKQYVNQQKSQ